MTAARPSSPAGSAGAAAAAVAEICYNVPRVRDGATISVIVPVLDEEARIGSHLAELEATPGVDEVIVVDGDHLVDAGRGLELGEVAPDARLLVENGHDDRDRRAVPHARDVVADLSDRSGRRACRAGRG